MNRSEFMQLCGPLAPEDKTRVAHAYWLAKEMHRRQRRDGGERYFEHCRRVALILIERGPCDADEITSALLHDCVEDCFPPRDLLEKLFGSSVADAVFTLSKLAPVFDENDGIREKQKLSATEYYAAIAAAPAWVRRIKLADRLDNLCSMHVWSHARKQKYLAETATHILPIAQNTDEKLRRALVEACALYR